MKKIFLFFILGFCLIGIASVVLAQTVVDVFSTNVYSPSTPVQGLPNACYDSGSAPNTPRGCNEITETLYLPFGQPPEPINSQKGYRPMDAGGVSVSAYDPTNQTTNYCGFFQDTCNGPSTPLAPNGKQYVLEIACGSSLYHQFPGALPMSISNKVFVAQVDCSNLTLDIPNVLWTTSGTCYQNACRSTDPELGARQLTPWIDSSHTGVRLYFDLYNWGASPVGATTTQFTVVEDSTGATQTQAVATPPIAAANVISQMQAHFPLLLPGVYTATATIDSTFQSADANPFNNSLQAHFTIVCPPTGCSSGSYPPAIETVFPYNVYMSQAATWGTTITVYGRNFNQAVTAATIDNGALLLPLSNTSGSIIGTESVEFSLSNANMALLGPGTHTIHTNGGNGTSSNVVSFIII